MKRLLTILVLLFAGFGLALAQRNVMGIVTGDGEPLIGATVVVKGASGGARTDINGKYSLPVSAGATTLVFSYTGYATQEVAIGTSNTVNIVMVNNTQLDEVVVTALGISRYKNELAYSAQKVDGSEITRTRDNNITNSLSGKVAGLQIKRNNNLGGSTNIVLRGSKSLLGDNQALFVIDGVPIDNSNTNTAGQRSARAGYDYGNAASDINPDDVESVTVLKGAAASALYGSRATNGVVMITTKKGSKKKGLGVTVNLGVNGGNYDPSTFVKYQKEYGGGYGAYYEDASGFFLSRDVDGNGTPDLVVPTSEDASWGGKFDPTLQVYQADAFDETSPNYNKSKPWVAAANDPTTFFETAVGTNNSIFIDGQNDNGYFKLGYTKTTDKGLMPNSRIDKDLVNFSAGYDVTSKLKVFSVVNFASTGGTGRYGTGYDAKNQMTSFRQWWQVNVDVKDQQADYNRNHSNATWNWADPTDLTPIYWDNPYWVREENYSTDHRNRYFGYMGTSYQLTNWLSLTGRVSLDQSDEFQEERIAYGSVDPSEYKRFNRHYQEYNLDLLAQTKSFKLGDKLKFEALVGANKRKQDISTILAKTNGGLSVPNLYALSNTKNAMEAPVETAPRIEVNGIFGQAGFVYNEWAILDLSMRGDRSSTLATDNNTYYYPAASAGIIFSKFLGTNDIISFGKIRANYAEVGNSAPYSSLYDTYSLQTAFDGVPVATSSTVKNNPDLKPERTKALEAGLEMRFLNSRVGFDVTYYKQNSVNQIFSAPVSRATGYSAKFINAGEIENKGIELQLFARPIHSTDFDWTIDLNWARNRSEVVSLSDGIDNLQLASMQGGVSINAALGEPYGTIRGNNFVYHENGQKIVAASGYYQQSATSNEVIGNINPDWTGGINNTLRYKNLTLGFLVDVRQGGDLFSLDLYYGMATGLYQETTGKNDTGDDFRSPVSADGLSGGYLVPGVLADGTPNAKRVSTVNFGILGYRRNPAAAFIYDASFVKLRDITLNYDMPKKWLGSDNTIKGLTVGLYARNPWIISKNLPYADPEDGMSSGNVQGYQVGSYPTQRTFGVNLQAKF
jgi:TonB-linked SusC/RagA family outer membrane protein